MRVRDNEQTCLQLIYLMRFRIYCFITSTEQSNFSWFYEKFSFLHCNLFPASPMFYGISTIKKYDLLQFEIAILKIDLMSVQNHSAPFFWSAWFANFPRGVFTSHSLKVSLLFSSLFQFSSFFCFWFLCSKNKTHTIYWKYQKQNLFVRVKVVAEKGSKGWSVSALSIQSLHNVCKVLCLKHAFIWMDTSIEAENLQCVIVIGIELFCISFFSFWFFFLSFCSNYSFTIRRVSCSMN